MSSTNDSGYDRASGNVRSTIVLSEVTDSQPPMSTCIVPKQNACSARGCGDGVEKISSPRFGLTKFRQHVDWGGRAAPVSISVPGINRYWPLPMLPPGWHDRPDVPEFDASAYADYAARAKLVGTKITCESDGCASLLAGDIAGGLVTSSTWSIGKNGQVRSSYTISCGV